MCVCTSVAGSPEARRGVPVDLTSQREGTLVMLSYHKVRGNYKATIAQTAGSRCAWLGRGDRGCTVAH